MFPDIRPHKGIFMKKRLSSVLIKLAILSSVSPLAVTTAMAACTGAGGDGSLVTCSDTTNQRVGNGNAAGNDNWTVNIGPGATIDVGDINAISLRDNAIINIGGTVHNNAVRNGGLFGTGANTIEVRNNAQITIDAGGIVKKSGSENNGEVINVHGFGNQITNNGLIETERSAAIWFQDWASEISYGTNKVVNNGTIRRIGGGNVIGTSAANSSAPGIDFTNNGLVDGSLLFAGGNDKLTFLPGSNVTGDIDGGGGQNDLTLDGGNVIVGGELKGAIKNFTTLTKIGDGIWTVSGPLQGFTAVTVQQGALGLTGNNDGFSGRLLVMPGASISARAQSLPTNNPTLGNTNNVEIQSGATLTFAQDDDGTYVGQIVGGGDVTKSGSGTITLAPEAGQNLYSGPTTIQNGGLAISSAGALGTGALSVNNGRLIFNDSFTFDKSIFLGGAQAGQTAVIDTQGNNIDLVQGLNGINTNATFIKTGSGILTLNAENTYAGVTQVEGGTLRVNNNGANNLTGQLIIYNNARLDGVGTMGSATLPTISSGTIAPGQDGNPFGTLTLRGDFQGNPGALVEINTVLGSDDSQTSKLVINGSTVNYVTPTAVRVFNRGGTGAETQKGIEIIHVDGNSDSTAFRLVHDYMTPNGTPAVIGGAYVYYMSQIDSNWYLYTLRQKDDNGHNNPPTPPGPDNPPVMHPGISIYEVYAQVLGSFNKIGTLQQRVGNRSWASFSQDKVARNGDVERRDIEESGIWSRVEGTIGRFQPKNSTFGSKYDLEFWRAQIGIDKPVSIKDDGSSLIWGVSAHYGRAIGDIRKTYHEGKITTNGYGFGSTLTWYDQSGYYSDIQTQFSWLKSDLRSDVLVKESVNDNKGFAYAVGLEVGKIYEYAPNWSLTPQAQMIYSDVHFNSFKDAFGSQVSNTDHDSLVGRLGLALDYDKSSLNRNGEVNRAKFYTIADVYYEFLNGTKVNVAGQDFRYQEERVWLGPSVGGSYNWNNDKYSVYGEVGAKTTAKNFGDSYAFTGQVGFRVAF